MVAVAGFKAGGYDAVAVLRKNNKWWRYYVTGLAVIAVTVIIAVPLLVTQTVLECRLRPGTNGMCPVLRENKILMDLLARAYNATAKNYRKVMDPADIHQLPVKLVPCNSTTPQVPEKTPVCIAVVICLTMFMAIMLLGMAGLFGYCVKSV